MSAQAQKFRFFEKKLSGCPLSVPWRCSRSICLSIWPFRHVLKPTKLSEKRKNKIEGTTTLKLSMVKRLKAKKIFWRRKNFVKNFVKNICQKRLSQIRQKNCQKNYQNSFIISLFRQKIPSRNSSKFVKNFCQKHLSIKLSN